MKHSRRDVSVIIPTLNSAQHIASLLTPLLEQTLSQDRYEIVVVNNGSTDETSNVLDELSAQAENLRWVMEPRRGRAEARNRGIAESSGELIVFLDDDVEIASDHLERHLAYHKKASEPVAVIGHVVDDSPVQPAWLRDYFLSRQTIGSSGPTGGHTEIPLGLYFITQSVSLSRSTLEDVAMKVGNQKAYFDPTLKRRQDGDVGCRLVKNGVRFIFAEDIVCYHRHPRNLGDMLRRSYEVGRSTARLLEKHPEASAGTKYLTSSPWINSGLLLACLALFGPAFLMRPIWTEPLNKVIGGLLLYQKNRGYQQALSERA